MAVRGLRYYCALIPRYYLLGLPELLVDAAFRFLWPSELKMGIRLVDSARRASSPSIAAVDAALGLIARIDRVRFRRVQTEIRTIVNLPVVLGFCYERPLRLCSVDIAWLCEGGDPETTRKLLASVLVHEATLGHLFSHGILRNRWNYSRVERLRCAEAKRFLQRAGMTHTPWDAIEEFTPVAWRLRWNLLREKLREWPFGSEREP